NKVRGAEFVVPEVYLEAIRSLKKADSTYMQWRIMTLIQNIGDRAGFLHLENVKLLVKSGQETFEGCYYRKQSTYERILAGELVPDKLKPVFLKVGETDFNFIQRAYDFILPGELEIWDEAILTLEGKSSTHKDEMKAFTKRLPVNVEKFSIL
ncbi:MAG: hypothetical protein ACFFDT_38095, partial [Candidatus Hodarchaeota archaeon]